MSDSEQQPVFETPVNEVVPTEPEPEPEPEPEVVKPKKIKKPMSDERKAQLKANLIKGRATSLANRKAKAAVKGTFRKVKTLEENEAEEQALDLAKVRIAEAEARQESRETGKHARAEAKEAMALAKQLRTELDELKAERKASKSRKAAIKAEQAQATAAIEAAKPKIVPKKAAPTGRDLINLMKGM